VSGRDEAALVDVSLVEAVLERAAMGPVRREPSRREELLGGRAPPGLAGARRVRHRDPLSVGVPLHPPPPVLAAAPRPERRSGRRPRAVRRAVLLCAPGRGGRADRGGPDPRAPGHRRAWVRRHPVVGHAARRSPRRDHRRRPVSGLGDRGPPTPGAAGSWTVSSVGFSPTCPPTPTASGPRHSSGT
jgi:hypothetical protein